MGKRGPKFRLGAVEGEVLAALAGGATQRQVAETFGCTVGTVKNHLARMRVTRQASVEWALRSAAAIKCQRGTPGRRPR